MDSNHARPVLETSHRPAGDLELSERTVAATDTLADTTRFPAGPESHSVCAPEWRKAEGTIPTPVRVPLVFEAETSPCSFHLPKWRMAVGLDPHTVAGTSRVQAGGAPRALHHPELAESSELESHAIAGARRLANECEPRSLYSPKW